MRLPQPTHAKYSALLHDISRGQIKIPQFQRDFVWSVQKSAALIDSIVKGFPVGTFIFWATRDRLRHIRNIGPDHLPPPKEGEVASYVLDGQQRITSLYATFKGLKVERESGQVDDFSAIYIDLEAAQDEHIVITDISQKEEKKYISLNDLLNGGLKVLASYDASFHGKLEDYRSRIDSYDFPIVEVRDVPIDVATEIFTRINVGGTPLTLFEIMVAKTYDETKNFDLAKKYDDLLERLQPFNYETISDATILQTVSVVLTQECKKQTILKITKSEFIDVWPKTMSALESAVEYFRNAYGIAVSSLLPYNSLLVPFTYYFFKHESPPDNEARRSLEDFFWRVSLAGRYSSAVESKIAQDIKRVDGILRGEAVSYDWSIDITPDFIIENGWFNTGRSFVKAILCLLANQGPKSFRDNSKVNISNNWLKQSNSKNYHHFFPKAFLVRKRFESGLINNIVNITIVDDYLNKREIGSKPPSQYIAAYAEDNIGLASTLKTHLIDMKSFNDLAGDYELFMGMRAKAISRELRKRIITRSVDSHGQIASANDVEESVVAYE